MPKNELPTPDTIKEKFLASAAGMTVEVPKPITREEMYLDAIAKGGSSGDAYTKAQTNALLDEKADLSILTPMTQAQYDALVAKTAPLYFIYEGGEGT